MGRLCGLCPQDGVTRVLKDGGGWRDGLSVGVCLRASSPKSHSVCPWDEGDCVFPRACVSCVFVFVSRATLVAVR